MLSLGWWWWWWWYQTNNPLRLYCYAQKHVRSIRAVTKDPGEIQEKRYRSIRRINKPNKKLKMRNLHHSSPYHVSDHKAAITVGVIKLFYLPKKYEKLSIINFISLHTYSIQKVIMGVFLGKFLLSYRITRVIKSIFYCNKDRYKFISSCYEFCK